MCPSSPLVKDNFIDHARNLRRRKSMPISLPETHIHRTESELQLYEDMIAAEHRDMCFFNRLVSGIRQRQQLHYTLQNHSTGHLQETQKRYLTQTSVTDHSEFSDSSHTHSVHHADKCIENIISTRCNSSPDLDSSKHNESNLVNLWANGENEENRGRESQCDNNDSEWAIEGFDLNQDAHHDDENLIDDDDEHSHHVFDIEL